MKDDNLEDIEKIIIDSKIEIKADKDYNEKLINKLSKYENKRIVAINKPILATSFSVAIVLVAIFYNSSYYTEYVSFITNFILAINKLKLVGILF